MHGASSSLVACALAMSAVAPRAASAQTIPSPYAFVEERQEVGAFAGWADAGPGRFGYGPKGGPIFGVRYAVDLTGPLSLEGSVGILDGTRDVVTPTLPEGQGTIGEADIVMTLIEGRLRLAATGARTWHGLSPFLVLGAGVAFAPTKVSAADALLDADERFKFGTKFVGTAGPGIRWSITRHLALRTDLGLAIWQLTTPEGFGDVTLGLENVAEKEWVSSKSLTASIIFRW